MNWRTFDPSTDTYDLELRYSVNILIPDTKDHEKYTEGAFSDIYANAYFTSEYTSLMSLATSVLAKVQYDTDIQF